MLSTEQTIETAASLDVSVVEGSQIAEFLASNNVGLTFEAGAWSLDEAGLSGWTERFNPRPNDAPAVPFEIRA